MTDTSGLNGKVRSVMAEQLGIDPAEIKPEANILDDLGADSLDVVELVMALEEIFDIEVPDEAVEGLNTVGDIEAYIASQVS